MTTKTTAKPKEAEAPSEYTLGLDEFCIQLSENCKRVELIGGFNADERIAGRLSDLPTAYQSRFEAFAVRPA